MMTFLILIYVFILIESLNLTLIAMICFVMTYQSTQGAVFFVYAAEVATGPAFGFSLMMMNFFLMAQTFTVPILFDTAVGVKGVFLGFGVFQLLVCLVLFLCLKETKGLTNSEKKTLYAKKD